MPLHDLVPIPFQPRDKLLLDVGKECFRVSMHQLKLTMDPSGVQYNNRPDVDPDNQRWMDLKAACEGALEWDRELKTWYARGKQKKCMKVYEIIKKVQQLSHSKSQQCVVFRHLQNHGRK